MPELPEVETVRRGLAAALPGATIAAVTLQREALRYPIPVAAVAALRGARLVGVRRRAKYLLLDTDADGTALLVHLGMSGRLFVSDAPPAAPARHEHWWLDLRAADGRALRLRYVDARRFGALDVVGEDGRHRLLDSLGVEPLGDAFGPSTLARAAAGRSAAVKTLLMDSGVVVGVGNIYASEACFRAGVRPQRPAASLDPGETAALVAAVRAVLTDAIAAGGTTLRDFVGGDERPGYFQQRLDVYGRAGAPCTRCGAASAVVLSRDLGRATYHCPRCQR